MRLVWVIVQVYGVRIDSWFVCFGAQATHTIHTLMSLSVVVILFKAPEVFNTKVEKLCMFKNWFIISVVCELLNLCFREEKSERDFWLLHRIFHWFAFIIVVYVICLHFIFLQFSLPSIGLDSVQSRAFRLRNCHCVCLCQYVSIVNCKQWRNKLCRVIRATTYGVQRCICDAF